MDGCVSKLVRVNVSLLGQAENHACELEAGRLDGLGSPADAGSDPRPSVVECSPDGLQLVWAVRRVLKKSARFHSEPQLPAAPPAAV